MKELPDYPGTSVSTMVSTTARNDIGEDGTLHLTLGPTPSTGW